MTRYGPCPSPTRLLGVVDLNHKVYLTIWLVDLKHKVYFIWNFPNPLLSKTYLSDGWHAMNIRVLAPDIYESWCGD